MVRSEFCSESLSGYKIKGPTHASVDHNLQIQIHEADLKSCIANNKTYSQIYAYFTPSLPPHRSFSVKEAELMQAMNEANNSYTAWKKMKEQLQQASSNYFNC
ncbi:MAG: hypothetical protein H0V82_05150 [Candidatus Protochlamydia sp.]|nr:hypothetical protein [Candidatus Protochlamydia sp.]